MLSQCKARKADQTIICSAIDSSQLFSRNVDPTARRRLNHTLLSLHLVIPSLQTFHENMKYLSIGAKILKRHLDILPKTNALRSRVTTLYQPLTSYWNTACRPLIEVKEGRFIYLQGPTCPALAFMQLFVSVLRQFSFLSIEPALRDFRAEAMPAYIDQHRLQRLLRPARLLGYENAKIREGL